MEIWIYGRVIEAAPPRIKLGGVRGEEGTPWYLWVSYFPKEGDPALEVGDLVFFAARLSSFERKDGRKAVSLTATRAQKIKALAPGDKDLPVGRAEVQGFGNLASDPDLRYTPTGKAVLNGRIALSDGQGEKRKTHFLPFVLWGEEAERVADLLKKGDRVAFRGFLQGESWLSKEGEKRYGLKIEMTLFIPLERSTTPSRTEHQGEDLSPELPPEEDLPF